MTPPRRRGAGSTVDSRTMRNTLLSAGYARNRTTTACSNDLVGHLWIRRLPPPRTPELESTIRSWLRPASTMLRRIDSATLSMESPRRSPPAHFSLGLAASQNRGLRLSRSGGFGFVPKDEVRSSLPRRHPALVWTTRTSRCGNGIEMPSRSKRCLIALVSSNAIVAKSSRFVHA